MLFMPNVSDVADWVEVSLYTTAYGALHPSLNPHTPPQSYALVLTPFRPHSSLLTFELDCAQVPSIMTWLQYLLSACIQLIISRFPTASFVSIQPHA